MYICTTHSNAPFSVQIMPRPQSPASDAGDDSNDMMMQEELERLRNQLLLLEGDRQALIQETNVDIRRQKEEMRRLESDNEELKTWMSLVESGQNKKKDNEVLASLCDLRDEYDTLMVKIDSERQKSQTLDADVSAQHQNICIFHVLFCHGYMAG